MILPASVGDRDKLWYRGIRRRIDITLMAERTPEAEPWFVLVASAGRSAASLVEQMWNIGCATVSVT